MSVTFVYYASRVFANHQSKYGSFFIFSFISAGGKTPGDDDNNNNSRVMRDFCINQSRSRKDKDANFPRIERFDVSLRERIR